MVGLHAAYKNSIDETHRIKTHHIMKFTILLKITAFAMLATSSSVYASEDHTVQHSLRGSILDEDPITDEELYSNNGGSGLSPNCCFVLVGDNCPAGGYQSTEIINGMQLCCIDPQGGAVSNSPMCRMRKQPR